MVIDVIRATSTIASALAQGAAGVVPVAKVEDAFALKSASRGAVAGERGACPLEGFDLGNSPEDFLRKRARQPVCDPDDDERHAGARGVRRCAGGGDGELLNLDAVAARFAGVEPPWLAVCAGCNGFFGVDDAIVAGALAEALEQDHAFVHLYRSVKKDLPETLLGSEAGA